MGWLYNAVYPEPSKSLKYANDNVAEAKYLSNRYFMVSFEPEDIPLRPLYISILLYWFVIL